MIIINDEAKLRVKCEKVLPEEYEYLKNKLENELNYANKLGKSGIGLAASQIGIHKHIAIIRFKDVNLDLVNAEIINKYDSFLFKEEGCLSFPGKTQDTIRYNEVHVKNDVIPYNFVATGLLAVAIQHEIDHLNEKLFFDYAVPKIQPKLGVNDSCFCGSGKKFKKCCRK